MGWNCCGARGPAPTLTRLCGVRGPQDDLPSEDEDDEATASDMGDFASAIAGGDDY